MIYILLFLMLGGIDRITKLAALYYCKNEFFFIPNFFSCLLSFNRGISWGMFHNGSSYIFWFLTMLIFCTLCLVILYAYEQSKKKYSILPEFLIVIGALSNFYDRIFYGGVIDFIAVSYYSWHFPIFNIADIYIVLGASLLIIKGLLYD